MNKALRLKKENSVVYHKLCIKVQGATTRLLCLLEKLIPVLESWQLDNEGPCTAAHHRSLEKPTLTTWRAELLGIEVFHQFNISTGFIECLAENHTLGKRSIILPNFSMQSHTTSLKRY